MIVVISAQQADFTGPIDVRFGRAPFYIHIDSETKNWVAHANPAVSQSGGAGVAAAQHLIDNKAGVAISGDFGPNASQALRAAGVEMFTITGDIPSVSAAYDLYCLGKLSKFS